MRHWPILLIVVAVVLGAGRESSAQTLRGGVDTARRSARTAAERTQPIRWSCNSASSGGEQRQDTTVRRCDKCDRCEGSRNELTQSSFLSSQN